MVFNFTPNLHAGAVPSIYGVSGAPLAPILYQSELENPSTPWSLSALEI